MGERFNKDDHKFLILIRKGNNCHTKIKTIFKNTLYKK